MATLHIAGALAVFPCGEEGLSNYLLPVTSSSNIFYSTIANNSILTCFQFFSFILSSAARIGAASINFAGGNAGTDISPMTAGRLFTADAAASSETCV